MNNETVKIENMVEAVVTKHRGRPVVEGSARQLRLAARAARGGEIKRGRPSNPNSNRQAKLAARIAILANGGEVRRGRPKMIKEEVVA
jgi:hypothetical protein